MIEKKVRLLHKSSERMVESLGVDRDRYWWRFIQREAWIHLKRTAELLWHVLTRKN